ncbi:SGNH/GDSL hydrolase family protein [Anatilimnocola floriformis]|uniref:SGNH/GDSL hydrolase family protein n=1 Tax=Anatilimnocola floriformis TaxID=2948575 RepID=UPI0020C53251|nr:SGNH/GDSL hydrolase family protein [Anatilimnocola floriformis]
MLCRIWSVFFTLAAISIAHAAEPAVPLKLKENDVWVMAGDSITAQRQHSNYIEAFFRTRYPELKLQFRNSGVGGHTMQSTSARFDYDIAAFKPTIVSIELGMNDVGAGDDPKKYIEGAVKLIGQVRSAGATPVLITSSPVNDGSKMESWKGDRCRRIHPYSEALKQLATDEKLTYVDQYHPLLALWANNKDESNKDKIGLIGDPVHPGPVGQYTMAATIITGLDVNREVSSATLQADGKVVETKGCMITATKAADGGLTFTRQDEKLPWPIPAQSRAALKLMPEIADLSRYLLTVTGLAAGDYTISIGGKDAAKVTAEELARGVNMATFENGAIAERGAKIVEQINKLQGGLNNNFRGASKAKDETKLAEAQKEIAATEAELTKLVQPEAVEIAIKPVK